MPRDEWWSYDPETQHDLEVKALQMATSRKCTTCYAAEYRNERHRENGGEMKGHHVVFEPVD